ncbi:hypothetical protein GGE68_001449 [Rhizobium leguminosarum]|uniref:hypothetical protein n=1 Tax=Rhizobium leguminosarum TaxID=384 RepID=UPI001613B56B|nr:hypothetical protein [Rhizobium leguminosarum]MBB5663273.1 hypothetical protein [Rhizobium leguminosarum]
MKAKWIGKSGVLPVGAVVEVLAIDFSEMDPQDCWVKYRPEAGGPPQYRSCLISETQPIDDRPLIDPYISPPSQKADVPISGSFDYEEVRRRLLSADEPQPILRIYGHNFEGLSFGDQD